MDSNATYWNAVAADWQHSPDALWRRHSDAVNAALLRRWLPPGAARMLKTDLFDEAVSGGPLFGSGGLPPAPATRIVGEDVAVAVVAAARKAVGTGLLAVVGDARAQPFAAGAFDAVVSLSTLDHFETVDNLARALDELRRILRTGGTLILTLDNPLNPAVGLRNRLPAGWLQRTGVIPYRAGATVGPRRLAAMAAAAGFDVRDAGAILHVPRLPAVRLCRRARRRTPAAQTALLGRLMAFERLAALPTRFLTGHFTALRATAGRGSLRV